MFAIVIIVLIAVPFALVLAALTYATVRALFQKGPIVAALILSLVATTFAVLSGAGIAALKRRRPFWRSRAHTSKSYRYESDKRAEQTNVKRDGLDVNDIRRLAAEIDDILKTSPISAQQKADLINQLRDVPHNLSNAISRLHRLRRIKDIVDRLPNADYAQRVRDDLVALEAELQAQVHTLHKTLLDMSVLLLRVDKVKDERALERMMTELRAANERLDNIAASYDDIQTDRRAYNLQ